MIGSASFVGTKSKGRLETAVYISIDNVVKGKFLIQNKYRKGVFKIFKSLSKEQNLVVLSGDNEGEKDFLKAKLPLDTRLLFQQKPKDKLEFIQKLQNTGEQVLMIGDGLNDSGALAQSNVGVVIAEDVNVFSPACDAIIDASQFEKMDKLIRVGKAAKKIIIASFILSFLYNIVGLSFAVSGNLSPIIAAILMPLSSISVVAFVTVLSNVFVKKAISNEGY